MPAISKLLLPPRSLSGCLFAGIYRDTRGVELCDADRVNHFPASPLVSVSLVLAGELRLVPPGCNWPAARKAPPLPSVITKGPQDSALSSWAPGPCAAVSIGIYPDAWRHLGGDPGFAHPPDAMRPALDALRAGSDVTRGWDAFCAALTAPWARARGRDAHPLSGIADWTRALVARAVQDGRGQSLRSVERRIKRISGQTRRELEFFSAFENLHKVSVRETDAPLVEVALDAGYADQSHMGRAVRRATGMSPARLNKAIETQEAFWCYRLLGERF